MNRPEDMVSRHLSSVITYIAAIEEHQASKSVPSCPSMNIVVGDTASDEDDPLQSKAPRVPQIIKCLDLLARSNAEKC